jgi:hypothetical protein
VIAASLHSGRQPLRADSRAGKKTRLSAKGPNGGSSSKEVFQQAALKRMHFYRTEIKGQLEVFSASIPTWEHAPICARYQGLSLQDWVKSLKISVFLSSPRAQQKVS